MALLAEVKIAWFLCVENIELVIELHFKGFQSVINAYQRDWSLKRSANYKWVCIRIYGLNLTQCVYTGYVYRELDTLAPALILRTLITSNSQIITQGKAECILPATCLFSHTQSYCSLSHSVNKSCQINHNYR